MLSYEGDFSSHAAFIFSSSAAVACIALFVLGALKSRYSTMTWYISGFEMMCLGAICGLSAYIIGALGACLLGV